MGMLAKPLVGAIATYFLLDTGLVAAAIASSTGRHLVDVWREDFLWSGVTFMVAGGAGAMAAVLIARGYHWLAILYLAPVYLTYRTYVLFIDRLEDERRHVVEMQRLEETRIQLLEREHAARAAAEEANRLKDQFLAIVSHELRTPLNAILGWSDMLRAGTLDASRRARAFTAIHDSATRQAQLIDELLDLARIMSGKLRLERTFVDLEEVVRGALNVVQPAADAKRIVVGLTLDPSLGVIYADRSRLQQIALEPAVERDQVHARRRIRPDARAARRRRRRDDRHRHRRGHPTGLSCRRCSSRSARRMDRPRASMAVSGLASRSSSTSSRRTVGRWPPKATARARAPR